MQIINTILMAMEFGTGWFYLTSFATFVIIMALTENEHENFSFVALGGFIYLMETAGTFNIFTDLWAFAGWVGVYFIAGIFWSFVKWFAFLHTKADELRDIRKNYIERNAPNGTKKLPLELEDSFYDHLVLQGYFRYSSKDGFIPQIRNYKNKCARWIIWWPTSLVWTVMSDPMVRIAGWLVNRLRGLYQGVANRVFSEFE